MYWCRFLLTLTVVLCVPGFAFAVASAELMVLAPETLYSNGTASLSVTAVDPVAHGPVDIRVRAAVTSPTTVPEVVFEANTGPEGHVAAQFDVPDLDAGTYTLEIYPLGAGETLETGIEIRQMPVLLVETDKPIYKPGQTIHGRVLVLGNDLRPAASDVEIDITDGKGIRIYRETLTANAFGVAPFDLDLASELNFGTWKISVTSAYAAGSVDIQVEEYVLPKFEVGVDTGTDWVIVDQPISGAISADYFFGKPVDGTVEVRASRYVGVWEEFASYVGTLVDGVVEFELPAVEYVSGTPGAGGAGSATLDVTVTDTSGHEETSSALLRVVSSPVQLQLIASSPVLRAGEPYDVLVVAEDPDGMPLDVEVDLAAEFRRWPGDEPIVREVTVTTSGGISETTFDVPENSAHLVVDAFADIDGYHSETSLESFSSYSPTSSFLHLKRSADGVVNVGEMVTIDAVSTHDVTVYYDVFASGRTVFSDYTRNGQIVFQATARMAPAAKVVAYIINPNNEVSADSLPIEVAIQDAAGLDAWFDVDTAVPGDPVNVGIQADAESMIGISIVDKSVYALSEGRLNMRDVFNELERRFMEPQAESHVGTYGAQDVLEGAGVQMIVSSGLDVPSGQKDDMWRFMENVDVAGGEGEGEGEGEPEAPTAEDDGLAEVERVRQFFPETWLWMPDLLTDPTGAAVIELDAPDSITSWRLHAVSTSENGLGIVESELVVFQEFFGDVDLPYAVTRGEQFPVRVQVYNYLDIPQTVRVDIVAGDWFNLLDADSLSVTVDANSVAGESFLIEPTELGRRTVEVSFRSTERADAVRREIIVEPEGTSREAVNNGILTGGDTITLDTSMPGDIVPGSGKILLSVTPSLVAQSIDGVGDLVGMPYGCGEQNMIFFAPDVEILRYLHATDQVTPELRAEIEHFITVGYQRELTYQREDGSFSAFGDSDEIGSLWLTSFVLGTFSGARDVHTIDETVLAMAADWIESHQLPDGSWEPVGFVHHSEMVGGVEDNFALTAYVAVALAEYGGASAGVIDDATSYLAANLTSVHDNAYSLALASYALSRLDKASTATAIDLLLDLAIVDENGIHWSPFDIETTAYAALAFMEEDMTTQANDAIKWISLQRNGLGGYNSTQDTVMAIKALMTAARLQQQNANLLVMARKPGDGEVLAEFTVDASNFDVLQIAEMPLDTAVDLTAEGTGEVNYQVARRFNVLLPENAVGTGMSLDVVYNADDIAVDDIVDVYVSVGYLGTLDSSGMLIVDVGVPTGFGTVRESLDALVDAGTASRIETAGRKVIFYLDGLAGGGTLDFEFQVRALYPVRAFIPDSQTYVYYDAAVRAEDKGDAITVGLYHKTDDTDGDGLPNGWEEANGLAIDDSDGHNGAAGDRDGDGLTNLQEYQAGTSPNSLDSDGDYAQDRWEVAMGYDAANAADTPERIAGDVDGDGETTAVDIQKTINQALGIPGQSIDIKADFDRDTKVTATDIQSVINIVLEV